MNLTWKKEIELKLKSRKTSGDVIMGIEDFKTGAHDGRGVKNPDAEYKDEDWLRTQVFHQNKSSDDIAEEFDVTGRCIRKWMNDFGITQKHVQSNHINLYQYQLDIIDGTVLGDAGFYTKSSGYGNPHYQLANYVQEYLKYIVHVMPAKMFTDKCYQENGVVSRAFIEFNEMRSKWYKDGSKKLPNGFELNSLKLLHWYLCDGTLATNGPVIDALWCSSDEADILRCEISNIVGQCRLYKHKRDGKIEYKFSIGKDFEIEFFETIGPPVINEYSYKWRRSE